MKTRKTKLMIITAVVLSVLVISGCGIFDSFTNPFNSTDPTAIPSALPTPAATMGTEERDALETIQSGFSAVYTQVLPSVVNIQVSKTVEGAFPFNFQMPGDGENNQQFGLGSGFVWDQEGHIVTNNHVIEGADLVMVTFHDGTSVDGEVIGTDPDSDLAVVKVDYPKDQLQPIQVTDSTQVQVGQLVASIGNPFGLQGTMTIGVISALGRSLPIGSTNAQGSTYTIPDVIQTDASINPGNSGGVLVDMDSRLVGVTTAIESSSGVNAGIGFVVPSVIVQKVVPVLIEKGIFEHPWIGIAGTTLTSDMAEAMGISRDQRGVLVIDVVEDGPAEKAGLRGSDQSIELNNQEFNLGGDVILTIDSYPTQDFEDLTAYLARHTEAGQTVTLTLLRDGKQETLDLILGVRPTTTPQVETRVEDDQQLGIPWLGISGLTISSPIAEVMELPTDQTGVLIQEVIEASPAAEAGLEGGDNSVTLNGEQVLVGGDVITGIDDQEIETMIDLQTAVLKYAPGDRVTLEIIRDGDPLSIEVELGSRP